MVRFVGDGLLISQTMAGANVVHTGCTSMSLTLVSIPIRQGGSNTKKTCPAEGFRIGRFVRPIEMRPGIDRGGVSLPLRFKSIVGLGAGCSVTGKSHAAA